MAEEWFRSKAWDEHARAEFESRLARARHYNRAQYLMIKGSALHDAGEIEAARGLWQRVLEDAGEFATLHGFSALEQLGDSYAADDPPLAEHYYRRLIADNPKLNMTTATQHIKLAELLIHRGTGGDLAEANELLSTWCEEVEIPFPNAHFRWNLAVISLAEALGDPDEARSAARRALALAARGSAFSRHPDVGLVRVDRRTLKRLRRLAG